MKRSLYSGSGRLWPFLLLMLSVLSCSENRSGDSSLDTTIGSITTEISADSIEANIHRLAGFHTRHTASDTLSDSVGIGAARRWIHSCFSRYSRSSGGRLRVSYNRYTQQPRGALTRPTDIVNVVAVLPGIQLESKDRIYVVSGHYDSRVSDAADDTSFAPGANDDASGTAAVLELARVMSQYEFDATIVFMAVAGEEQGLLGAAHYARQARENNLNIAGMFTNDIIGSPVAEDGSRHDGVVRVFADGVSPGDRLSRYERILLGTGGENDTPSRQLGRYIQEVAQEHMDELSVNLIYRRDRYQRGGDHSAFLDEGYPAVRFSEPNEDFRHQHQDVRIENGEEYGDLVKFVDAGYVAKVARLNAASLAALANAPAIPERVGMETARLENRTTLRWKSNAEPDLMGYEIVWRNTTSPVWEFSRFAGDTTRYTIEGVSKDNYLFGVRAVDRYGYKSPAVYPLPVR